MSSSVGVLGCGWLGLPLARSLVKEGYLVHGSTTSEKKLDPLKNEGVIPFKIILGENKIEGAIANFLDLLDVLIINVPPGLRSGKSENYVRKMELLHNEVINSKVQKVVFISSTSVYGNAEGEVTEESRATPITESGIQLLAAENIFRNEENLQTTIIRFGGLIGPDRHPVTFLSGRENLRNGTHYVNLVHLNDCIGMILFILENAYWNETFNGVYPDHPQKSEYYTREAQKRGLQAPKYVLKNSKNKGKQIISRNFLNKKYCFSTPLSD